MSISRTVSSTGAATKLITMPIKYADHVDTMESRETNIPSDFTRTDSMH